MSSTLSATALAFQPFSQSPAGNASELLLTIVCRTNEDIGTYEDGVLRPRKGVTCLIAWKGTTQFITDAPFAADAHIATEIPVPFAEPDELAAVEPAAALVVTDEIDTIETEVTGDDILKFQQDEELSLVQPDVTDNFPYHMPLPQMRDLYDQILIAEPPYHPAPQSFHSPTYEPHVTLPCDIAVSEANRPAWNPAYHKAISPSIERANRVVEEFKVYFGDGRYPDHLMQLRKICFLCGLCEAHDLPQSIEGCIAVSSFPSPVPPPFPATVLTIHSPQILRETSINVFDLVEAGRADEQGWIFRVPTFRSSKQFFDYSRDEGKVCPRWIGKANPLFQDVLMRFR